MNIWFAEGDGAGWAIDEDLRLLTRALNGHAAFTPLARADCVLAVWWWKLLNIPRRNLRRKRIVAIADNPPFQYVQHPSFLAGCEAVDLWIARSTEALDQFRQLGLPAAFAPYVVDAEVFHPLTPGDPQVAGWREQHGVPQNAFLIGNFHRDTEAGSGLPKFQKAPEAFVEILRLLRAKGVPVHGLLAGPRRHWIRAALKEIGIPFTFVGDLSVSGDDYPRNILPREELNVLYNTLDAYLIVSRWEGGPHSVLEACAAACPVLSTPVGVSRDLLPSKQLFEDVHEAAEKLHEMWQRHSPTSQAERRQQILDLHSPSALAAALLPALADVTQTSNPPPASTREPLWKARPPTHPVARWSQRLMGLVRGPLRVSLPVSGHNQPGDCFLAAFKTSDAARGRAIRFCHSSNAQVICHASGDEVVVTNTTGHRTVRIGFSVRWLLTQLDAGESLNRLTVLPPVFPCPIPEWQPVNALLSGHPAVADENAAMAEWIGFGGCLLRAGQSGRQDMTKVEAHADTYARLARMEHPDSVWRRFLELLRMLRAG